MKDNFINWFSINKLFTIIIIPILISIVVGFQMQNYFDSKEIKKEFTTKITSLEDEIITYNELFLNNYPLKFLISLENNLILYTDSLKYTRKELQRLINKAEGDNLDSTLAKYILEYSTQNLVSSHQAYLKIAIQIYMYDVKYKSIQSKLKIITQKVKALNLELQCSDNTNIFNNLIIKFNQREKDHNNLISHILKVHATFHTKYKDQYISVNQYKSFVSSLTPTYIFDYKYKYDYKTLNNSIAYLSKINSQYISKYNRDTITLDEYCTYYE